jgi:hypothetical protein
MGVKVIHAANNFAKYQPAIINFQIIMLCVGSNIAQNICICWNLPHLQF